MFSKEVGGGGVPHQHVRGRKAENSGGVKVGRNTTQFRTDSFMHALV
jgi:hypothetical protein